MAIIVFILLAVAGICVYDFLDGRNWQSATSNSRNMVIFENRNRKYGAYNLRTEYNDSLGIIIAIISFVLLIVVIINRTLAPAIPERIEMPSIIEDTVLLHITAPPVEEAQTVKVPFKIKGGSPGGAGSPSNDPVIRRPMEQTQKVATIAKSDVSVFSGQSNKTNGFNKNNAPSTMVKSPFAGAGGATRGDKPGIFGNDYGPNYGPTGHGTEIGGSIPKRKKITNLSSDDLESDFDCTIYLKLQVNAEGNVIKAENISKKTTTTNAVIIARISELVKRQIKYEKANGAAIQIFELSVNLHAR